MRGKSDAPRQETPEFIGIQMPSCGTENAEQQYAPEMSNRGDGLAEQLKEGGTLTKDAQYSSQPA